MASGQKKTSEKKTRKSYGKGPKIRSLLPDSEEYDYLALQILLTLGACLIKVSRKPGKQ